MSVLNIILTGVGAFMLVLGIVGKAATRKGATEDTKKQKKKSRLFTVSLLFGLWLLIGTLLSAFSIGKSGLTVEFELFSERIDIFGISVAKTAVLSVLLTLIATVLCLIFRLFIFPKFSMEKPTGFQNVIELGVEAMENFASGTLHDYSGELAPYMFSLALFMIMSAATELFGLRAPTSDLTTTLAMGLLTFILINAYGIRKKGVGGRIKALSNPTPLVLPMKILSDVAVPVSLGCRLFGNMLGGMIVMDLLKSVLGGYGSGLPAIAGIYFNLFHPLIQAYIFVILSMTFINEAIE